MSDVREIMDKVIKQADEDGPSTEGTPDNEAPAPGEPTAKIEASPEGDPTEGGGDDDVLDPIEPPTDWDLEHQTAFRELPRSAQEFMIGRYGEERKVRDDYGKVKADYDRYASILDENQRRIASYNNMDDVGYIKSALTVVNWAQQDPNGFLNWYQKNFNTAPQTQDQARQQKPQAEDEWLDLTAQRHFTELNKRLGESEAARKHEQEQFMAMQAQSAQGQIEKFRTASDDSGNPKHPYFDEVKVQMGELMELANAKGRNLTLDDAYDQACRLNGGVHAKILDNEKRSHERKAAEERRKSSQQASKAGKSIPSSGIVPGAKTKGYDGSVPLSQFIANLAEDQMKGA